MRYGLLIAFLLLPLTLLAQTPPDDPMAISPIDGAVGEELSPIFSWSISMVPVTYTLQIATHPGFHPDHIVVTRTLTYESEEAGPLSPLTLYYWRVIASNEDGTSNWSAIQSFTTKAIPPATPALLSPPHTELGVSLSPTLTWSAPAGATGYLLKVSTDEAFPAGSTVQYTPSTATAGIGPLQPRTRYYWSVKATNSGGESETSAIRQFETLGPPRAPDVGSPGDGYLYMALESPNFYWNYENGEDSEDDTYHYQISRHPDFSVIIADAAALTEPTVEFPGSLEQETFYYWRVSATNSHGTSAWSSTHFRSIPYPPVSGTPVQPADGATRLSPQPVIKWLKIPDITTYRLQIAKDPDFAVIVFNDSAMYDTAFTSFPLDSGATYYWHVRARNMGGAGIWSPTRSFTIIPPVPVAPTLVSPADGAVDVSLLPTLVWKNPAGSTTFGYRVYGDAALTELVTGGNAGSGLDSSAAIVLPSRSTTYYWTVRGGNATGFSQWSAPYSFTTLPPAPPAPTLLSPDDQITGTVIRPALSWSPVSGASRYILFVSSDAGQYLNGTIDTLTGTSHTVDTLQPNRKYFWWVKSIGIGGISALSDPRAFTTQLPIPNTPIQRDPVDQAINVKLDASLNWYFTRYTDTYHYQIATDPDFTHIVQEDSQAAVFIFNFVPAYKPSTTYYRRVSAKNASGTSPWSPVFSFSTVPPRPGTPSVIYPKANAGNISLNPILTWNATATTDSYRISLAGNALWDSTLIIPTVTKTLSDTTLQLGPLLPDVYYSITLMALNAVDSSLKYYTAFLTVPPLPGLPTLAQPSTQSENQPVKPTLVWKSVARAGSYRLQIALTADFATPTRDTLIAKDTSITLNGLGHDLKHYWRIAAVNPGGTGAWSDTWEFTTIVTLPAAMQLLRPAPGELVSADSLLAAWQPGSSKADRYWVEVSRDTAFSESLIDSTITDTAKIIANASATGLFWWRVKAHNAAGWGEFSAIRSFEVKAVPTAILAGASAFRWSRGKEMLVYHLPKSVPVSIRIYNPSGKLVSMPVHARQPQGTHTLSLGRELRSPGLYFLSFRAGEFYREERFIWGN